MTKFHQDELLKKEKTIIYLFGFIGSWLHHIGSSLQHAGPFVMAQGWSSYDTRAQLPLRMWDLSSLIRD